MFNPPHVGHLVCAQEARWQLRLDEVLLMPAGDPPHRGIEHDPGPGERFELCRLAAAGVEWLRVSRAELDRPGPSYTADTLAQLRESRPADELFLILGADQARNLGEWHDPARVVAAATLAVVERAGATVEDARAAVAAVGRARLEAIAMPRIDVSSTDVRRRVTEGRPYRFLVPDAVAERIEREGLYR